jgi:hypothetical protein
MPLEVTSRQIGQWDWILADSILCEAIHPIRGGLKTHWAGKNKSKDRWMVGIKVVVIVYILSWELDTANIHDQHFAWLVEKFEVNVLSNSGFQAKEDDPEN